jgi:hypothetical protein
VRTTIERKMNRAHSAWARRGGSAGKSHPPKLYMVTLTLPHEGVPGRIEQLLDDAWRKLRQHASKTHWSRDTLAVLEWTPGRDGKGHPHLHVLVVASYLDYTEVRASWRRAALRVGAQEPRGRGIDIEPNKGGRKNAARDAANYVAKYLTSGDKVGLYSVEDWVRLCAWQVGRRTLRATRGWWDYEPAACPCCEQRALWRGWKGSAWTNGTEGGRSTGSAERWKWAVRLYYDPLSGWCRTWVADDLSSVDSMYGTMSMVESSYPLGDERICEPVDKKDLDMEKYRHDAYLAKVKYLAKIKGGGG